VRRAARRGAPERLGARSFRHGASTIEFDLVRSDRGTLGLTVGRDGAVVARAPRRAQEADVMRWVASHAEWIFRRQRDAAERAVRTPPRRFVDGELHLYLGHEYRLTIERGEVERDRRAHGADAHGVAARGVAAQRAAERVRFDGRAFRVTVGAGAPPGRVAELMDAWYMRRARTVLAERLDACWAAFPGDGRPQPTLRVKRMRSRWGSMSPKGAMSLRLDLIRAPVECIDYVILHELCHLPHRGHGREFWAMVALLVPDWKDRRKRLELLPA
jgi:predicted metal-dependent hydrolase